jgi:methionyl-tRNA formyltransferase
MIKKEDGALDFNEPAEELAVKVRAFWSWPATFAMLNDSFVKICAAYSIEDESGMNPGDVCRVEKDGIYVQTGKGQLVITKIQIQGKKAMPVRDFLNGKAVNVGDKFTKHD